MRGMYEFGNGIGGKGRGGKGKKGATPFSRLFTINHKASINHDV